MDESKEDEVDEEWDEERRARLTDRLTQAFWEAGRVATIASVHDVLRKNTRANYILWEGTCELLVIYFNASEMELHRAMQVLTEILPLGIRKTVRSLPSDEDFAVIDSAWRLGGTDAVRKLLEEMGAL